MNKEEILAMDKKTLNKAVIEYIMHHKWDDGGRPKCLICGLWKDWPYPSGCEGKNYVEDMLYAWEVKEEMNRQGFHFRLADYGEEGNQQAIFEKPSYEPFVAICPKAPEAICKSALIALLHVGMRET